MIHDAVPEVIQPLYAVASWSTAAGEVILKVVNVSNVSQDTELDLLGAKDVQAEARAIVLTSDDHANENTLDAPTKVAPVTKNINNAAPKFRFTFPAQSVTIMRLKMPPSNL